jgi:hypothetical protein
MICMIFTLLFLFDTLWPFLLNRGLQGIEILIFYLFLLSFFILQGKFFFFIKLIFSVSLAGINVLEVVNLDDLLL